MNARFLLLGLGLSSLVLLSCQEASDAEGSSDGDGGDGDSGGTGNGGDATGGSGSDAGCKVEFSPPADLRIDTVTQEQAEQICLEYGEVMLCMFPEPDACRLEGILEAHQAGDDPEVCRAVEAECLENGSKTQEEFTDCAGAEIEEDCAATVGEVERCWADIFQQVMDVDSPEFTCDEVPDYFEWAETLPTPDRPPSCAPLDTCQPQ